MATDSGRSDLVVRPMAAADLSAATTIFRQAFGTQLGMRDPNRFWADREFLAHRRRAWPDGALVAVQDGQVVGSNIANRWGRVGWFGPLTVDPDCWGRGVAQRLLARTMDVFATWGVDHCGLFTFADSPKHAALYGKFGFRPGPLTVIMEKALTSGPSNGPDFTVASSVPTDQRAAFLAQCRTLTNNIQLGLDLAAEIEMAARLGDTVMIRQADQLDGFAVCHSGVGSEAGNDCCYIKFAAVRPGPDADELFDSLIAACETFAGSRSLGRLRAGVNCAREYAHRILQVRGFAAEHHGLIMTRDGAPGYNRPDAYVVDDWR